MAHTDDPIPNWIVSILEELHIQPVSKPIMTRAGLEWRRRMSPAEWSTWAKSVRSDPVTGGSREDIITALIERGLAEMRGNLITAAQARQIYNWRIEHEHNMPGVTVGEAHLRRQVYQRIITPHRPVDPRTGWPFTRANYFDVIEIMSTRLHPVRTLSSKEGARHQWERRHKEQEKPPPVPLVG